LVEAFCLDVRNSCKVPSLPGLGSIYGDAFPALTRWATNAAAPRLEWLTGIVFSALPLTL
jgi:hypothetical protein